MTRLSTCINLVDFYRYVVIYGRGVSDIFLQPENPKCDFLHALTSDLQSKGYQRILHVSPTSPVHVIDPNSEKLSENHLWRQRKEVLNTGIVHGLQVGPFGVIETKSKTGENTPRVDGLGDVNGFRIIDAMISEHSSFRTALVIYNAEVFLSYFSDKRILGGIFSDWLQLPLENQNTIFFVFTNTDINDLSETIKKTQVPELKSIFEENSNSPRYRVDGPDQDELFDLLTLLAQDQNIKIKITNMRLFVRWLESENVLLRTWFDRFSYVSEINVEIAKKNRWISSSRGDPRPFEEKLGDLVGLENIKERIRELRDWMSYHKNSLSNEESPNLHMVFYGNPGTGKTTVARMMGEMFHEFGFLKKGHVVEVKGSDLIADVVGGTAVKTNRVIDHAMDGVLFIDEAYSLSSKERGGFGQEALETLLVRMENERSRLVVILAGYSSKMREFLESNPGLDRRFSKGNRFEFPNFSISELESILFLEINKRKLVPSQDFLDYIPTFLEKMNRTGDDFGNAGEIRNIVESIERRCKARAFKDGTGKPEINIQDLPDEYQEKKLGVSPEDILSEFDEFVGLDNMKEYLRSMISLLLMETHRRVHLKSPKTETLLENFVFLGNPGTGKTSVARLIGKIYKSLGLLGRGHTVEVSAPNLIAGYVGQTQGKTKDVILDALDGVLFIDEAYALARNQGHGASSYGQEAIDILVKMIEDHRDRLVVIVAGYPEEMTNFINSNPGLKSRFGSILVFQDFSSEELGLILEKSLETNGYEWMPETIEAGIKVLEAVRLQNPKSFGNAREVRRLFFCMKRKMADRLYAKYKGFQNNEKNFHEINLFVPEDVEGFDQSDVLGTPLPYIFPNQIRSFKRNNT